MNEFGSFGKRLRTERERVGLNQKRLVARLEELGVSICQAQMSEMETKSRIPNGQVLAGLSKILGVSTDYLLGLTNEDQVESRALAELTELSATMIENSSILVKNQNAILRRLQSGYPRAQTKELA